MEIKLRNGSQKMKHNRKLKRINIEHIYLLIIVISIIVFEPFFHLDIPLKINIVI